MSISENCIDTIKKKKKKNYSHFFILMSFFYKVENSISNPQTQEGACRIVGGGDFRVLAIYKLLVIFIDFPIRGG